MSRLIDADAICSKCNWHDDEHTCDGCSLHSAPTVDAVVRDKGEWIDRSPYMGHYCSRCGRITGNAILYDGTLISKFCDNCGADMRGEQHDE